MLHFPPTRTLSAALWFATLIYFIECDFHYLSVNKDFGRINADPKLKNESLVAEVTEMMKAFDPVLVAHPRLPLLYRLLQRAARSYARRKDDSLYNPRVFRA